MRAVFLLAFLISAVACRELCHTAQQCNLGSDCACIGSAEGSTGKCELVKGFDNPVCIFHADEKFQFPLTWGDLSLFDTSTDMPSHLIVEGAAPAATNSDPDSFLHKMWELFSHYRVSYDREHETPEHARDAFVHFVDNYRYALNHNSQEGGSPYTLGPNSNFEYSWSDFLRRFLHMDPTPTNNMRRDAPAVDKNTLPASVDWREKNVLTPIKNQGTCGACYAIAAVQVVESAHAIKSGEVVPLSMQQPVECSQSYGNFGCSGGMPENVYKYLMSGKKLATEADYPYVGSALTDCNRAAEGKGAFGISSFQNVNGDETNLMEAVRDHVVHVSVKVTRNFQLYKGGVLDDEECLDGDRPNHAILAVGYTQMDGTDVWILRNSWGETFGDKGYLYLKRGKNMCSIMEHPSFVEI